MKEKDFEILAGLMAEVIRKNKPVKDEVKRYRQGFVEMKYCLPGEEALELASKLFLSLFPSKEFAQMLVDSLARKVKELTS